MTQCKKHVYKTMCETDNGYRHGKNGSTRYESTKKGMSIERAKKTTTKKTTKKRARA